jgi:hypothetical protein
MYLDPGFGGMFIQVLVAIVAAGGILIFSLRRKLKALFSKNHSVGVSAEPRDKYNASGDTDFAGDSVLDSSEDGLIDMLSLSNAAAGGEETEND